MSLAHTHAQGSFGFSEKKPNGMGGYSGDKAMAEEYNLNIYLVNKIGELKLFNYKTQQDKTVKNNLPGSENKPLMDENGNSIDYTKKGG